MTQAATIASVCSTVSLTGCSTTSTQNTRRRTILCIPQTKTSPHMHPSYYKDCTDTRNEFQRTRGSKRQKSTKDKLKQTSKHRGSVRVIVDSATVAITSVESVRALKLAASSALRFHAALDVGHDLHAALQDLIP